MWTSYQEKLKVLNLHETSSAHSWRSVNIRINATTPTLPLDMTLKLPYEYVKNGLYFERIF